MTVVVRTCWPRVGRPCGQRRSAHRANGAHQPVRQHAVDLVQVRLQVVGDDDLAVPGLRRLAGSARTASARVLSSATLTASS